ncbi:YrbL family protein, partial [Aliarcobacter butzleri]|uniref:YrbL family protein n=1 Tax=Aliarcobacter butzleri TaxID=28197 RepID=UPI003AF8026E
ETNLGKGLIFDRVMNYDDTPSKSFRYLIANKIITFHEQEILLNQLKNYLEKNQILFADNSLTNILCKEIRKNEYELIIIDGLGAK